MDSKEKYLVLLIIIMGVVHVTEAKRRFFNIESAPNAMTSAPASVDDRYTGCEVDMLDKVLEPGGLLEMELEADGDYLAAWNNGNTCRKQIPGARDEHSIALAVFTSDFNFYDKFNSAVTTLGGTVDIYKTKFPYKSLHFLLNDALRILNKTQCYEGCSGTHYNLSKTEVNADVRMGTYRWGSPFMERFCQTEFKVMSCLAVDVKEYSCFKDIDVVIPPYELFQVTAVDMVQNGARTLITMKSKGASWKHQCSYLKRDDPPDHVGHVDYSASVLLAASIFILLIT